MRQLGKKHPVVQKVEAEIERTLADYGYELVQITYGGGAQRRTLSVYMDKPGRVALSDCQDMANRLSVLLDVLDPISQSYDLIVSSPGVERPLTRDADFDRFAGKPAAVTFADGTRKTTREGVLRGLDDDSVVLETDDGLLRIPLDLIDGGHLIYDVDDDS
jgi:ribosome maturation factor RimP